MLLFYYCQWPDSNPLTYDHKSTVLPPCHTLFVTANAQRFKWMSLESPIFFRNIYFFFLCGFLTGVKRPIWLFSSWSNVIKLFWLYSWKTNDVKDSKFWTHFNLVQFHFIKTKNEILQLLTLKCSFEPKARVFGESSQQFIFFLTYKRAQ